MEIKHSVGTKLVSNTFFISLEWVAITVLSFFFWLVIGKTLSPEDYGIVSVFVNFTVIFGSLLPLGTSLALFKLIPEYIRRNESGKITSSIRFTVKLILITTLISSFFILAFSDFISASLKIPRYMVLLLPLSLFFFSMLNHQSQIILGFQRARWSAITSAFGQGVRTILSAILIFANMKFAGPVIAFLIGSVVMFVSRIKYLNYRAKPVEINRKDMVLTFGLPAFLAKITNILLFSGGALILALFHTPQTVGIFGIAMLLTSQLSVIPNIFSSALFPITSILSVDKNSEKRQARLINLIFRYSLLITMPLLAFVTLFSGKLIVLFSQVSYLGAKPLVPILSIGSLLLGVSYIFTNSLYAIGKTNVQRNLIISTAVIYLLLAFPLSYLFSSFGVSIAYAISSLILFLSSFAYLRKVLKFNISWRNTSKLLLANLISFGMLYYLSNFAPTIWVGILYTSITGAVYLILLLLFRFYTQDDINLINRLSVHLPAGRNYAKTLVNIISRFSER